MSKIFFSLAVVALTLMPLTASAQLDSRCWTKPACENARLKMAAGDPTARDEGLVTNSETIQACGGAKNADNEDIGFCLPAGKTVTQIAFGGKREFLHLGEFIQYMYQYGIIVAGVLAVLMIFAAGFEWLTSGGNSERISSAQKRIAGALMGLFLAVTSYVILNTINPYLTTLRLPQIWLINQQADIPVLCSSLEPNTKIALARNQTETLDQAGLTSRYENAVKTNAFGVQEAACKNEYFVEKAGLQTCRGTVCPNRGSSAQVCATTPDNLNNFNCYTGSIAGTIYNAESLQLIADELTYNLFGEQWVYPWTDEGETELWGICTDGKMFEYPVTDTTTNNSQKRTQNYTIRLDDNNIESRIEKPYPDGCGGLDKFKGFVLNFEMNESIDSSDEDHYIGSNGSEGTTNQVDLGDNQHFHETFRRSLDPKRLISIKQLKGGYILNVNAGKIQDFD